MRLPFNHCRRKSACNISTFIVQIIIFAWIFPEIIKEHFVLLLTPSCLPQMQLPIIVQHHHLGIDVLVRKLPHQGVGPRSGRFSSQNIRHIFAIEARSINRNTRHRCHCWQPVHCPNDGVRRSTGRNMPWPTNKEWFSQPTLKKVMFATAKSPRPSHHVGWVRLRILQYWCSAMIC